MPFIQVNNLLHYYEHSGGGIPLVFIHGAFCDSNLWEPQWQYFSSKYQVIRYDLRGHGRTGRSSLNHYMISTFADDLAALLDALEIQSPVICGLSMGGVIAQAFAVHHPEKSRALILASTSVSASLTLGEKLVRFVLMPKWAVLGAIRGLGAKRFKRFSLWLASRLWGKQWLGTQKEAQDYVEQCMLNMDNEEYLKIWEAIYGFDRLPLERITRPTLVLNGELESRGMLRHTEEILRCVPQATTRIIPGVSHAMTLENPGAFNQILEDFLLTAPISP
jgi:pimeloyl-ACP methyl ester carboxylesterase